MHLMFIVTRRIFPPACEKLSVKYLPILYAYAAGPSQCAMQRPTSSGRIKESGRTAADIERPNMRRVVGRCSDASTLLRPLDVGRLHVGRSMSAAVPQRNAPMGHSRFHLHLHNNLIFKPVDQRRPLTTYIPLLSAIASYSDGAATYTARRTARVIFLC